MMLKVHTHEEMASYFVLLQSTLWYEVVYSDKLILFCVQYGPDMDLWSSGELSFEFGMAINKELAPRIRC